MTSPEVAVVIVNWNSCDYLRTCLAALLAVTRTPVEVVVIDAGSFDGAEDMIEREFPAVRFIQCDRNVGFAKANNLAFRETTAPVLLFLNPDTEARSPFVDVLLYELRRIPDAGMLGARLLNANGSVQQTSVMPFPTLLNQLLDSRLLQQWMPSASLWGAKALRKAGDEPVRVQAVSGACVMLRRNVFVAIGLFNEDYFMYAEDLDLAHEVSKRGLGVYHVPRAVVTHYGGSSSGQAGSAFSAVMLKEANYRFLVKTRGRRYAQAYRASVLVTSTLRIILLWTVSGASARASRHGYRERASRWLQVMRWAMGNRKLVTAYYP